MNLIPLFVEHAFQQILDLIDGKITLNECDDQTLKLMNNLPSTKDHPDLMKEIRKRKINQLNNEEYENKKRV